MYITGITLERAMRVLNGEPYTIGTENGEGWIYYFDGKILHDGTDGFVSFNELLGRECMEVFKRSGREYLDDEDDTYMEQLNAGLAFIVTGSDSGTI